ncbi:MAG: Na+/H+ antiporter NhaA [Planctomycetes bacterium]|nr:Na+/H+ antiporter NhaA [Planctomycetota bacterium]
MAGCTCGIRTSRSGFDDARLTKSVAHWINDGLMVVFFFFVGLELKHEARDGHLQSLRHAALPIAAAIGGMAVPAAVYATTVLACGAEATALRGWGIPMATDIAFALGVLALLGRRVPAGLKVFLATLAIADDLGAVLVIAIFYTDEIAWHYLAIGAAILAASYGANRAGVRTTWPYVICGVLIWLTFLQSGVHATIAGVALALTVPARRGLDEREFSRRGRALLDEFDRVADPTPRTNAEQLVVVHELQRHAEAVQAPLQRMAHGLAPRVAHGIVPVFALANAGIDLRSGLGDAIDHPAARAVFLGLLVGKPAGVLLASLLAVRLLGCALPARVTWRHLHGAAWLAGIGFPCRCSSTAWRSRTLRLRSTPPRSRSSPRRRSPARSGSCCAEPGRHPAVTRRVRATGAGEHSRVKCRAMRAALSPFLLTTLLHAQSAAAPLAPQTVPKRPATQTSRLADVQKFLDTLMKLPHGNRVEVSVLGKSHEGRPLLLAKAALPAADPQRLRAVVIANIHAGECEGKEAVQMLLREFALGQHEDLLRGAELWFLPVYNPDGNEAVDRKNRPEQNGPDTVGKRPNGQGLDLNRDFVKADAPETRAAAADRHRRSARVHGPAHDRRQHARLPPDVRAQPGDVTRSGDRQLRAQAARWRDHDDAASPRLPRVRLRQLRDPRLGRQRRAGEQGATRLVDLRLAGPLRHQLVRSAQPDRRAQRGLQLCRLPDPDRRDSRVRADGARQGGGRSRQAARHLRTRRPATGAAGRAAVSRLRFGVRRPRVPAWCWSARSTGSTCRTVSARDWR